MLRTNFADAALVVIVGPIDPGFGIAIRQAKRTVSGLRALADALRQVAASIEADALELEQIG